VKPSRFEDLVSMITELKEILQRVEHRIENERSLLVAA
jgi:hypothetical protein